MDKVAAELAVNGLAVVGGPCDVTSTDSVREAVAARGMVISAGKMSDLWSGSPGGHPAGT